MRNKTEINDSIPRMDMKFVGNEYKNVRRKKAENDTAKESLKERIKQAFYPVKRLQLQITTIHIPGKSNSTTDSLETMQIRGLHTEGWNDLNDLQDMELHAADRHIRNSIQQTNQQLCNSGSQRLRDIFPQNVQLQMEQSQITHSFVNTKRILEIGQRMKDKDQKLPLGNVGAFLLDLLQTLEKTYQ
ncbi:MAG: hypothetical protein EZS28_034707 [Streblomastix strix]|uniref:Uncharacterized protein n=1 Tax=Streblomastix strix TaxID=222440 RepID=A0A5J4UH76_9EUKA|nr:MAG: hypothetical protein EZS28_034707 [Streblomastix strix]